MANPEAAAWGCPPACCFAFTATGSPRRHSAPGPRDAAHAAPAPAPGPAVLSPGTAPTSLLRSPSGSRSPAGTTKGKARSPGTAGASSGSPHPDLPNPRHQHRARPSALHAQAAPCASRARSPRSPGPCCHAWRPFVLPFPLQPVWHTKLSPPPGLVSTTDGVSSVSKTHGQTPTPRSEVPPKTVQSLPLSLPWPLPSSSTGPR